MDESQVDIDSGIARRARLGTTYGTYKVAGTIPTTGTITVKGTAKTLGGTGAFKGTKLSGTLTCTTKDGGQHDSCTAVAK